LRSSSFATFEYSCGVIVGVAFMLGWNRQHTPKHRRKRANTGCHAPSGQFNVRKMPLISMYRCEGRIFNAAHLGAHGRLTQEDNNSAVGAERVFSFDLDSCGTLAQGDLASEARWLATALAETDPAAFPQLLRM